MQPRSSVLGIELDLIMDQRLKNNLRAGQSQLQTHIKGGIILDEQAVHMSQDKLLRLQFTADQQVRIAAPVSFRPNIKAIQKGPGYGLRILAAMIHPAVQLAHS